MAVVASVSALALAPYRSSGTGPAGPGPRLSVLAWNLAFDNGELDRAADVLTERATDLVVLSEYTPHAATALADVAARYPYVIEFPSEGPFGIAVFSRWPTADTALLGAGAGGADGLRTTLRFHGRPVLLYALHWRAPTTPDDARRRNRALSALAAEMGQTGSPAIVAGDLNMTPFSPHYRALIARTPLVDLRRGQGYLATWPPWPVPFSIPIDHVLATPHWSVVALSALPPAGSDHRPLYAELALTGPGPAP
jgi:endonuclease/exonuclease/phosphatase (EEP) superfamily protein YafD